MFEMDGVSVTLECYSTEYQCLVMLLLIKWCQDLRLIMQKTVMNLTVFYNTPTNVTITATSCGQNSETAITSVELIYGKPKLPCFNFFDGVLIIAALLD